MTDSSKMIQRRSTAKVQLLPRQLLMSATGRNQLMQPFTYTNE